MFVGWLGLGLGRGVGVGGGGGGGVGVGAGPGAGAGGLATNVFVGRTHAENQQKNLLRLSHPSLSGVSLLPRFVPSI